MQAAARPYTSPPHTLYHPAFQTGAQDYELKKQYLALLPPQQIIDICLSFDLHVPPFIRSTVWPLDINAAIAALTKTSRSSAPASSENQRTADNVPIMDSLNNSERGGHDKPAADDPTSASSHTSSEPGQTTSDNTNANSQASTQPSPTPHPYPHPPHAAYPHAPYYPPPSAAYHPHSSYPGYPPPSMYPPNPLFSFPSASHTPQLHDPYSTQAGDDLPSYEEMIVEALTESNDPEGCAPKDLFIWMASHYPLQSNFRPSASQALQKAFKRGRFEKTSGGKYRLNATWEGGNTSRRTTRRPQTLSQSATPSTSALPPPFTQVPLVHHHVQHPGRPPYAGPPYGYPYPPMGLGYPPYPSPGNPPQSTQTPISASASSDSRALVADKEARDAYETAQNILRAINFGSLLQMSNGNNEANKEHAANSATLEDTGLQGASAVGSTGTPGTAVPIDPGGGAQGVRFEGTGSRTTATETETMGPRAQVQAQLALLAAQLAEIAGQANAVCTAEAAPANSSSEEDDMEAVI